MVVQMPVIRQILAEVLEPYECYSNNNCYGLVAIDHLCESHRF